MAYTPFTPLVKRGPETDGPSTPSLFHSEKNRKTYTGSGLPEISLCYRRTPPSPDEPPKTPS